MYKNYKKYGEAMKARDWQTCDLIAEEHEELVRTIAKQAALIEKLKNELGDVKVRYMELYDKHDDLNVQMDKQSILIERLYQFLDRSREGFDTDELEGLLIEINDI